MEDLRLLEILLFSGLDRINLAKLIPELERVNFQPGEILFKQGDPGDSLFIIIDGKARIFFSDQEKGGREITTMGPKECFGEMALLTGEPRSANIQAVTELSVLKLSRERFDNLLMKHHSLAIYFANLLARRLASTQRDLKYCKDLMAKEGKLEGQIPTPTIIWRKPRPSQMAKSILNKFFLGIILTVLLCFLSAFFLNSAGLHRSHIILIELILTAPMALTLSETLRFKNHSPGSIGLAMSCLLGFGQMSFLFMNGAAVCFLIYGLLPAEVSSGITWGSWLKAAFPMGIIFFLLSYLAIALFYQPEEKIELSSEIIKAQLKTLGPLTTHEKISLLTVVISILGFLTQPWHGINGAWVAMLGFIILFGTSVLDEKAVRTDIDWNFLISFGALVGFGSAISSSGLTHLITEATRPYVEYFVGNKLLFFLGISLAMHLLRFALPITPALLIGMLATLPVLAGFDANPFVTGLILLISSNPFFLPNQNMMYINIVSGTEGKMFRHGQVIKLAILHIAVVLVSIALTVPYWKFIGLIH